MADKVTEAASQFGLLSYAKRELDLSLDVFVLITEILLMEWENAEIQRKRKNFKYCF